MNRYRKKKVIASLLFISCLFGAWLLFVSPSNSSKQLQNFAQADSLLQLTLADFNIPKQQQSSKNIRIDSTFNRRTYQISVPPSFSKTQFHAVLQNRLSAYQVSLPAKVLFPERNMQIHLRFNGTIFRTVELITDKELTLNRSFASIILAFNDRPPQTLISTLKSMGEPIPIAIKMDDPLNIPEWWETLREQYSPVIIWPANSDGANLLNGERQNIATALQPLSESLPNATLLSFFENGPNARTVADQNNFSFIAAEDAFIFNSEMNESEFNQTFRNYVQQARNGTNPIAIIMGTQQTLQWTRRELNTFKKGGLFLRPPNER